MNFSERIHEKLNNSPFLILDGAVGTELERAGYLSSGKKWTALAAIEAPSLLYEMHKAYINAGADIITTHTFRTTPRALSSEHWESVLQKTVAIARQAIKDSGKEVLLAGSVAPLEDCYRPDLSPDAQTALPEHRELIQALMENGVDLIIGETFNTTRESQAFCQAAQELGAPYLISLITDDTGSMLSGESMPSFFNAIADFHPIAVLVNCRALGTIDKGLDEIRKCWPGLYGIYANGPGIPDHAKGWIPDPNDPVGQYTNAAKRWVNDGCAFIGGCCGTTAEHIASISAFRQSLMV